MTSRTAPDTYAVIEPPAPDSLTFIWTAHIHYKGYKRTEMIESYCEESLKKRCQARGVTRFVMMQDAE